MYNNVGNKIKVLAQVVGWLCFVAGIIAWIVLLACGEQIGWAVLGSGVLALVSSWFLYGFGQMVDDIHEMRGNEPASIPTPEEPTSKPVVEQKNAVVIEPKKMSKAEEKDESMATHNCPKCGAKNPISRVFCKECGERLS